MKKIVCLILCCLLFSAIFTARAEDLHDVNVLKQHFDNAQDFNAWYEQLNQKDKNLVLGGTVFACRPDLTKAALDMGGDLNTQLFALYIASGHDDEAADYIYAYNSGDVERFMAKAMADGMKRSAKAVKEESCGHTFSSMGSKFSGPISLPAVGVDICRNSDKSGEMLRLLLTRGADINYTNFMKVSPLSAAIESNDLETVKLLLENGADFSKTYALSRMVEGDYTEDGDDMWEFVTAYLKEHKLSPEAETDAYVRSKMNYDYRLAEKLAALSLRPDYTTEAAKEGVLLAASRGNYDLMKELVEHGVDVNYRDSRGRTALFLVAEDENPRAEDVEAVKYLLAHGADANIKDKRGKTAFDDCAYSVCKLNPNGAREIDINDKTVVPTLDRAIDGNDCETITHFVERGVDPYIDIYGTPLLFRLIRGEEGRACLEEVLKLGADLNKVYVREYGRADTALTYADSHAWSRSMVPLLKQYGATDEETQRVAEYNRLYEQQMARRYDEPTGEIEQKLAEKDLTDWEVAAYKKLLQETAKFRENRSKFRDFRRIK